MNFLIEWLLYYISIMFAMCTDNIFWISASPEYEQFKKSNWFRLSENWINVEGKTYPNKINYIIFYRIKSVLIHPRDIFPAIITSLILSLIW